MTYKKVDVQMPPDNLSPEDEFDLLVGAIGDRMAEYMRCMTEIPNVSQQLKIDLWNAAVNKRAEIDQLHTRLEEVKMTLAAAAPAQLTPAAKILIDACRAAQWTISAAHTDARAIAYECRTHADAIPNPMRRNSAWQWIERALGYAESGRRPAAIRCISNAKALLSSSDP